MTTPGEEYATASRGFLEKARQELERGELTQASEKLWGAAAQMVKSVAERRGWPHDGHRELFRVVHQIAEETGDPELRTVFQAANSLHTNFYENWQSRDFIEDSVGRIEQFVGKLEQL